MASLMDYMRAPKPGSTKISGGEYAYAYQPYRRGRTIEDDARVSLKGRAKRQMGRESVPAGRLIVLDRHLDEAVYLEEVEDKGWTSVTEQQAIEAFGANGVTAAHALTPVNIDLDPPWKNAATRLMPAETKRGNGKRTRSKSRDLGLTQESIDHRKKPRRRRR